MKTQLFKRSTLMVGGALFLTGLIAMIARVKHGATSAASSTVRKLKSTVAKMPTPKKSSKETETNKKTV